MTPAQAKQGRNARLIDRIEHAEHASLEAIRKFLDTVDDAFPHLSEDKPRRKIIDSAFEMTEQLVAASTQLAQNVVEMAQKAVSESERKPAASRKRATAPVKATKSAKATKKAPAKTR